MLRPGLGPPPASALAPAALWTSRLKATSFVTSGAPAAILTPMMLEIRSTWMFSSDSSASRGHHAQTCPKLGGHCKMHFYKSCLTTHKDRNCNPVQDTERAQCVSFARVRVVNCHDAHSDDQEANLHLIPLILRRSLTSLMMFNA